MHAIVWAAVAADDLAGIVDYLLADSPAGARAFVEKVDRAVRKLRTHPRLGRRVPELARQNILRYRELVLSPWRLFYRVEKGSVYVLAVIDGRRNIEDVLLRRLLR